MEPACLKLLALTLICLLLAKRFLEARLYTRTYLGCYKDNMTRDLPGLQGVSVLQGYSVHPTAHCVNLPTMTLELCGGVCALGGFPYMGIQIGGECYCGWSYGSWGLANTGACGSRCYGNSSQECGGSLLNSVYALNYTYPKIFQTSARANMTVQNTFAAYWNVTASSLAACLVQCSSACQAVIFSQQLQLCSLLKFALVPTDLSGLDGEFFVRY